ncbi:putative UDP-glucuronosyl/UDP-glucosyltransferase [Helianthus debilis subsp. tardiflorus]
MFQLANLLYSKGFSITIFHTNFNKPQTSNYPHFTFRFILDNDPHDERYANLPLQGMGAFSRIFLFNKCGADQLRHQMELELSAEGEPPVSCLITDASWHFTQSVADSLNLPRLVLRTRSLFCFLILFMLQYPFLMNLVTSIYPTTPPHLFLMVLVITMFLTTNVSYAFVRFLTNLLTIVFCSYINTLFDFIQGLEEQVAEFPVLKVKDVIKIGFKKDDGMGDIISNMVKQTKASSGIIWNSFKELEQLQLETIRQDIPTPTIREAFYNRIQQLTRPRSILFPLVRPTTTHFMEMVHGLVDSKQSFLWVVRPGFVSGSTWLEPLLDVFPGERGWIVKWAPQQEVLGHEAIGAFWTHSGWNSTVDITDTKLTQV